MPLSPGYASQFLARGDIQAIGHRRAQVVREAAIDLAWREVQHHGSQPDYHSSFYTRGPVPSGALTISWFIGNRSKQASWIEHGTRPHSINARNVPNLRFFWQREGVNFVGPHVNHPGGRAFHILERALRSSGGGLFR